MFPPGQTVIITDPTHHARLARMITHGIDHLAISTIVVTAQHPFPFMHDKARIEFVVTDARNGNGEQRGGDYLIRDIERAIMTATPEQIQHALNIHSNTGRNIMATDDQIPRVYAPDIDGLTPEEAYAKLAQTAIDNGNARTRHEYALNHLVKRARETGYEDRMQEEQDRAQPTTGEKAVAGPATHPAHMDQRQLTEYIEQRSLMAVVEIIEQLRADVENAERDKQRLLSTITNVRDAATNMLNTAAS